MYFQINGVQVGEFPERTVVNVGDFIVYRWNSYPSGAEAAVGTFYNFWAVSGPAFAGIYGPSGFEAEYSGLLGNANGNQTDDLATREGVYLSNEVLNVGFKLAQSWHEHDEDDPQLAYSFQLLISVDFFLIIQFPFGGDINRFYRALKLSFCRCQEPPGPEYHSCPPGTTSSNPCDVRFSYNAPENIFSSCVANMEQNFWRIVYNSCLLYYCNVYNETNDADKSHEAACEFFRTFAVDCNENGSPLSWLNVTECGKYKAHYFILNYLLFCLLF
jgi:hypothetical protein